MSDFVSGLLVALCPVAVMFLFFFIWKKQAKELAKVKFFLIVSILLFAVTVILAAIVLIFNADPNYDWARKLIMWSAAAFCIWYAAWCSQYKMDKEEGISRKL